ncbi:hypothetical protein PINS_up008523 [Pythium insidiosum]|nr:hypothetical protein PINS_up008523 [Pythium insidiosum]
MSTSAHALVATPQHHSAISVEVDIDKEAVGTEDIRMNPERRHLAGALIALAMLIYLLIMGSYVLLVQLQVESTVFATLNWHFFATVMLPVMIMALWRLIRWLQTDIDNNDGLRINNVTAFVYTLGDICLCALGLIALYFVVRRPLLNARSFHAF